MRAVDTSILVAALNRAHPRHDDARLLLASLAKGPAPWAIPWPCVYETIRLVTHPEVFHPPMPPERLRADLDALLAAPTLQLLGETERHAEVLRGLLAVTAVTGHLSQAAHVAALCLDHGVSELLTTDLDLLRFPGLRVVKPFE